MSRGRGFDNRRSWFGLAINVAGFGIYASAEPTRALVVGSQQRAVIITDYESRLASLGELEAVARYNNLRRAQQSE